MRVWFWMGLLAALTSCTAPEAQQQASKSTNEEAAKQPQQASLEALARQLVGKRLCRYPSGPDDTGNFEIELLEKGRIDGRGDFSGAAGILQLQNGHWQVQESTLQVELLFKGKMAEQENLVKFELSSEALLESQEECMAVHPGF